MEGFCRGCLIKYDEPVELLQYTEKNRRLYLYSTGLQVKRNDTFTFQLCKDCYLNMKMACKFKKHCRTADKRLKTYLALKEAGDTVDFCVFLKNNDDSMTFRFPTLSGFSTPNYQKTRDDDNESTCTSIRNFMSDFVQVDEIPDTEAKIIREVIQEEADLLEESLDSHWLQDDVSIDTDFRLDQSFSPFSTPRSVNNEFCTPKKLENDTVEEKVHKYFVSKEIVQERAQNNKDVSTSTKRLENEIIEGRSISGKFYTDKIEDILNDNGGQNTEKTECTIDKNLEEALKNDDSKEYLLDDLLLTPPVFPGVSAPSTPTINNILFGEKLDDESNSIKAGNCIPKYELVESDIDIFEEFIKESTEYKAINDNDANEFELIDVFECDAEKDEECAENQQTENCTENLNIEQCIKSKYDMNDFSCKICDKTYRSARTLKIHFAKYHKVIIEHLKKHSNRKLRICDYCGKGFHDKGNFTLHINSHLKPKGVKYKCDICSLECSDKSKLKMHMTTHLGKRVLDPPKKLYYCNICGSTSTSRGNLRVHQRRHEKSFSHKCNECESGFYRNSDLRRHMVTHTGIREFSCPVCYKMFNRRDVLNIHMKVHTGERNFQCEYCETKFKTKGDLKYHVETCKICIKRRLHSVTKEQDRIAHKKRRKNFTVCPCLTNGEKEEGNDKNKEPENNLTEKEIFNQ